MKHSEHEGVDGARGEYVTEFRPTPGMVFLIGGGPGAADLITLRGLKALEAADVILTDHLGPSSVLDELIDTTDKQVVDVSKLPYGRKVSQEKTNEMLVDFAREGKIVARLKGGDPFVFGRGFEEVQVLTQAGISVHVIPGVTSAISVPAAAGVPITQRGLVHSFTVISGHLPPGHEKSLNDWAALACTGGTLAVIMGVKNAPAIAASLIANGRPEPTPVALIEEGTTDRQRSFRCQLGELGSVIEANGVRPPAVYVIGEVAGL